MAEQHLDIVTHNSEKCSSSGLFCAIVIGLPIGNNVGPVKPFQTVDLKLIGVLKVKSG